MPIPAVDAGVAVAVVMLRRVFCLGSDRKLASVEWKDAVWEVLECEHSEAQLKALFGAGAVVDRCDSSGAKSKL